MDSLSRLLWHRKLLLRMRLFVLFRKHDVSGVSGTGIIAEGVEFTDGTVALRWLSDNPTITIHDGGLESVEAIHGHGGNTEIRFV